MADRPRILVVDDEEGIQEIITALLEDEGYTVRTASDGLAALEVLRSWSPDLILLDLMMPRLDGQGFVAERRRTHQQDIPLIVLSARRDLEAEGALLGAVATLKKPFELDDLVAVVGRTMQSIQRKALSEDA